jgi:hypothetical protein
MEIILSAADEIAKLEARIASSEADVLELYKLCTALRKSVELLGQSVPPPSPPPAPPPPSPPPPPPPNPVLDLPKITAPGTQQGVLMTRQVARMAPGWTAYQGRWYVDLAEIGGQATQSSKGVPVGKTVVYKEWVRNSSGDVLILESAPFGPITSPTATVSEFVVVSGGSNL